VSSRSSARIALAAALLALPALSGCVLNSAGATDIGQNSATLLGSGKTDDETAYVHFEYARSTSDLGTAAGSTTPERGPVPPHTPSDGRIVTFPEPITGLSPGHLYWSRACGRIAGKPGSACSSATSFFTDPSSSQDQLIGGATDGSTWDIDVTAAAGSHGENPDGRLYIVPQKGSKFDSTRITCLRVQGDTATVGSVGLWTPNYYGGPSEPGHALLTVVRDASAESGNRAYVNQAGAGGGAPDCTAGGTTTPYPVRALESGLTLYDAP
jgi:hypothetical protein